MNKTRWIVQSMAGGWVVALLSGCVQQPTAGYAANPDANAPRMLAKGNTQTDEWLQIQREGSQASSTPQRLSDAEYERANQRWLDSFTHPIPEFFERDAGGGFGQN